MLPEIRSETLDDDDCDDDYDDDYDSDYDYDDDDDDYDDDDYDDDDCDDDDCDDDYDVFCFEGNLALVRGGRFCKSFQPPLTFLPSREPNEGRTQG